MTNFDPPSTLKPAQVAVAMVEHGIAKHRTRGDVVFLKAVLAGVMLSFGGLLSEIISGGSAGITTNNPGLVKVLGGAVFPVGLIMIVLQGQELLTSNMMIFPMACLKGAVPWWGLPWNWLLVTFGNLCGSLFFAAVLTKYSGIISTEPYISYAQDFALHKAKEPEWYQIFLRGIGCNWLVCVAVWQAAGARDTLSKIVAIWIPIMIFVSAAFDHVIANMFSVPLGIMFGADLTVAEYIRKSLIASYLGNIVGGLIVALPATYFYLSDYSGGGLRGVEEGEVLNDAAIVNSDEDSSRNGKGREEAFEVVPGKSA
ncbi:Formate/nitrite transporter [Laetiporus sulphureus 93-53]|uniref:Formate/nitrite transporter n=1 Tax=Laetiporus sulphureus 93-53 TaxID=1314785 RepID=A0A165DDP3_9APHY|nr:Formate/nitrite transporter [Laetiporus sulphureus 93-53]KZT04651.1 Formate/nitrite transporter [Laetiporus sulphureus 93-53]